MLVPLSPKNQNSILIQFITFKVYFLNPWQPRLGRYPFPYRQSDEDFLVKLDIEKSLPVWKKIARKYSGRMPF
jgi:hypothetical protein